MNNDPIVAEVRANRTKLADKFNSDLKKLIADAKSRQTGSGHPLVSFVRQNPKAS